MFGEIGLPSRARYRELLGRRGPHDANTVGTDDGDEGWSEICDQLLHFREVSDKHGGHLLPAQVARCECEDAGVCKANGFSFAARLAHALVFRQNHPTAARYLGNPIVVRGILGEMAVVNFDLGACLPQSLRHRLAETPIDEEGWPFRHGHSSASSLDGHTMADIVANRNASSISPRVRS